MADDCISFVARWAGVDEDDAVDILEAVAAERDRLLAEGQIDELDRRLAAWAQGVGENISAEALMQQRRAAQDVVRRERMDAKLRELEEGGITKPREQLIAALLGTHKGVRGGRDSVYLLRAELEARWAGNVLARIEAERPHVLRLMREDQKFLDVGQRGAGRDQARGGLGRLRGGRRGEEKREAPRKAGGFKRSPGIDLLSH